MTPSVLIGIPYHDEKRYCVDHLLDWVNNQTYPNVEVVMRWHTGPFGELDAVKIQREFMRQLADDHEHDYFYSMGADTIPPLDVLERLISHGKDVVGAVYHQRKEREGTPPIAWVHGDEEKDFMKKGGLVKVDGMGGDAVLLSREAFTDFGYLDWDVNDDDWPLYDLLKSLGYDIWLDTDAVCRHYVTKDFYV